jgi:2-polyprenyl-6-methoxyphenol hydroxylase-like FAD-dependent oxidoreductase
MPGNSDLENDDGFRPQVLIVGAGPVGLFLALKIAQQGMKTLVIECENDIVKSPRATAYYSSFIELTLGIFQLCLMKWKRLEFMKM